MAVLDTLTHLAQVDIDAIHAYSQAIERSEDEDLASVLSAFRDDHRRHVDDLGAEIRKLGGDPPVQPDTTGFVIEGFTAVAASAGTAAALAAMESNEIVTNDAYHSALTEDLPSEISSLLLRNYDDEKRHLATIRSKLEAMPGGMALSAAARAQGWTMATWMNTLSRELPMALAIGAGAAAAALLAGLMTRPRGRSQSGFEEVTPPPPAREAEKRMLH